MQSTSSGGIVFFTGVAAATAYLGVWQSQRYSWKKELIATNAEKFHLPEIEINSAPRADMVEKYQGRKVKLTGYYDHSREVLVGPHSAPTGDSKAQGMATNAQGYHVITPLMLKCGDGAVIFVNRGWVLRDALRDTTVPYERPNWASVTGVVQKMEERNLFSPDNDPETGKLLWLNGKDLVLASKSRIGVSTQYDDGSAQFKDVNKSQEEHEDPIVVEAIADEAKDNGIADNKQGLVKYPIARESAYSYSSYATPETHLAYAFTWFALSAAAVGIAYMNYKKRNLRIAKQLRRQGKD